MTTTQTSLLKTSSSSANYIQNSVTVQANLKRERNIPLTCSFTCNSQMRKEWLQSTSVGRQLPLRSSSTIMEWASTPVKKKEDLQDLGSLVHLRKRMDNVVRRYLFSTSNLLVMKNVSPHSHLYSSIASTVLLRLWRICDPKSHMTFLSSFIHGRKNLS